MVTPSGPCQTKGTCSVLAPVASASWRVAVAGTKPATWLGAGPLALTQPLCASKKCAGSSANKRIGGAPGSGVTGYCSTSAVWIAPPSRVTRRTSVVTATTGAVPAAAIDGVGAFGAAGIAVFAAAGAPGIAGTARVAVLGVVVVVAASVAASWSLFQASHNMVATASQATIRNV